MDFVHGFPEKEGTKGHTKEGRYFHHLQSLEQMYNRVLSMRRSNLSLLSPKTYKFLPQIRLRVKRKDIMEKYTFFSFIPKLRRLGCDLFSQTEQRKLGQNNEFSLEFERIRFI